MSRLLLFKISLTLMCLLACSARAITISDLEQLLQSSSTEVLQFEETRESPWLDTAQISRGLMYSFPPMLEKRVEFPHRETWRLYPDRIEWLGPSHGDYKRISFSRSPQMAPLVNAVRGVALGELLALEKDFDISLAGDQSNWTILLKPHAVDAGQYLDFIEFSGTVSRVNKILIVEPQGERTTTRISPTENKR